MYLRKLAVPSCVLVLAAAAAAQPPTIVPAQLPWQRAAGADCVIVGKVTEIEAKTVQTVLRPGDRFKVELAVAKVKIDEGLLGTGGMTSLRVAFLKPPPIRRGPGGIGIGRPIPGLPQAKLAVGQEACLCLSKHATEPFYTITAWYNIIDKKSPTFAKDMESIRKVTKLLSHSNASLASKDTTERFETACLLLQRYLAVSRTGFGGQPFQMIKMEPIPAEESKKIMLALADGDWIKPDPLFGQISLATPLFNKLPDKTGFQAPPGGFKPGTWDAEAKKWLRNNAETYRIQRPATEKSEKSEKSPGK